MIDIAIISPSRNKYSETFIHKQVSLLPCNVHLLYGGYLPKYFGTNQSLERKAHWIAWTKNLLQPKSTDLLIKGIEKFLLKHKIKAVFAQYGPSGVEMMDVCQKLSIPLIVHFHGYDAFRSDILQDYGEKYPALFSMAEIICVSKDMQNQLLSLGAKKESTFIIPYGVDTKLFHPKYDKPKQPIFVSCGRFVQKKAPHLTIEAFSKTIEKVPSAKLQMIGSGELLQKCRLHAIALKVDHAVEFKGILKPHEIAASMQNALAFVQHSVKTEDGDSEGLPNAILEAGASGIPIVATNHAGIPDAVIDDVTGFLVEEHDTEHMANKMICLAQNQQLVQRMGIAARQHIIANYDQKKYINSIWSLIQKSI